MDLVVLVVLVVVVPVVPVAVPDVSVLLVPVVLVIVVLAVSVVIDVLDVPDVSVLLMAVADVSLVVIVDDVSLAAVSLTFTASSFLHPKANKAKAITMRMASVFFMFFPFCFWGWLTAEECEQVRLGAGPHLLARSR
ncbi:MAG: hypothetical protein ACXW3E_01165 [Thermoanaerobaculia bacterium]